MKMKTYRVKCTLTEDRKKCVVANRQETIAKADFTNFSHVDRKQNKTMSIRDSEWYANYIIEKEWLACVHA